MNWNMGYVMIVYESAYGYSIFGQSEDQSAQSWKWVEYEYARDIYLKHLGVNN